MLKLVQGFSFIMILLVVWALYLGYIPYALVTILIAFLVQISGLVPDIDLLPRNVQRNTSGQTGSGPNSNVFRGSNSGASPMFGSSASRLLNAGLPSTSATASQLPWQPFSTPPPVNINQSMQQQQQQQPNIPLLPPPPPLPQQQPVNQPQTNQQINQHQPRLQEFDDEYDNQAIEKELLKMEKPPRFNQQSDISSWWRHFSIYINSNRINLRNALRLLSTYMDNSQKDIL